MTVDPALSPREVADYYRERREEIVGKRHRDLSEKHMQLALSAATRPEGQTLGQSMEIWNQEHPDWSYKAVTNFGKDCKNALRRLLHPYTEWIPSTAPPSGSDDEA